MAKAKKQSADAQAGALQSAATSALAAESTSAPLAVPSVPKRKKVNSTAQPQVAPTAADAASDGLGGNFRDQALRLLSGDLTALAPNAEGGGRGATRPTETATGEDDSGEDAGGDGPEASAVGAESDDDNSHLADLGPADGDAPAAGGPADGAPAEGDEGEAAGEGETDEEADDEDLDALAELDDAPLDAHAKAKQWPASFHKRVKKFAKQHRQAVAHEARLSERVAELEQELEQRNGPESGAVGTPRPTSNGGPASLPEQALLKDIDLRERALGQIDAHLSSPEGMAGQPMEVGGQTFTIAQLRAEARKYEREVNQANAQLHQLRQTTETARRQFDAQAVTQHPWLKDQRNAETVAIESAFRNFPMLAQMPRMRLILADHLAYQKQLAAAKATSANGTNGKAHRPSAPAARAPARPAAAPLPAARAETDGRAAVSQVMKTGTHADAKKAVMHLIESRPR